MCDHSSPRARAAYLLLLSPSPVFPSSLHLSRAPAFALPLPAAASSPRPTYLLGSCTATLSCHCVGDATSEASNLILQLRGEGKRKRAESERERVCVCALRRKKKKKKKKRSARDSRVIRRWSPDTDVAPWLFTKRHAVVLVLSLLVVVVVVYRRPRCRERSRASLGLVLWKLAPPMRGYRFSLNSRGS